MSMTIADYRARNGLTLEAFGLLIGRSKGHMSEIERLNRCSAKLALAIEEKTRGQVDAASLNEEVAAARKVAA